MFADPTATTTTEATTTTTTAATTTTTAATTTTTAATTSTSIAITTTTVDTNASRVSNIPAIEDITSSVNQIMIEVPNDQAIAELMKSIVLFINNEVLNDGEA